MKCEKRVVEKMSIIGHIMEILKIKITWGKLDCKNISDKDSEQLFLQLFNGACHVSFSYVVYDGCEFESIVYVDSIINLTAYCMFKLRYVGGDPADASLVINGVRRDVKVEGTLVP